jgi:hypothetical protein
MADQRRLSATDLLAGTAAEHDVVVPARVLTPAGGDDPQSGVVRLRPLTVGTLVLISRAARDEPALVPLLLLKESLVEPVMTLDQLRTLHAGLVHYLVAAVNTISGLSPDGDVLQDALGSPTGQVHLLLAQHFGWTPEQVGKLTPGQAALYVAGVEGRPVAGTAP